MQQIIVHKKKLGIDLKTIFCFADIEGAVFRVFCPWPSAGVGFRGSLASFMAVAPSSLPPPTRLLCSLAAASKETAGTAMLLQSAGPWPKVDPLLVYILGCSKEGWYQVWLLELGTGIEY